MFNQMFGSYLVEKGVITRSRLKELLDRALNERVKLGTIAVAEGWLTDRETEDINHLQVQSDRRFGDIAIEQGYLTAQQVDALLSKQGNPFMKFLQLLFDEGIVGPTELEWNLDEFQTQNGFTDDDMEALKAEDIDQIVNLFAFSSKPYVTEIVGLLLRNITRFITDDYYIGHIERVDELVSSNMVMQRTFGDHSIYLGLAAAETQDGFIKMASDYAKEKFRSVDVLTYDALAEFINSISGIFATNLSHQGVSMDMEPPLAYGTQIVQGKAYVVPLFIGERKLNIYVSVDSHVIFANKPLELKVERVQESANSEYSRGRFVIVDDSALTRKILRQLLEDQGYSIVAEAVNGQEAVEAYKKYKPDMITLDITMPVMDGVDALKQIMAFDPKAKAVMITAAGQEKRVIEAIRTGASQFFVKPFNRDEVVRVVNKYFDDKEKK